MQAAATFYVKFVSKRLPELTAMHSLRLPSPAVPANPAAGDSKKTTLVVICHVPAVSLIFAT
jgi:hypothetical protein